MEWFILYQYRLNTDGYYDDLYAKYELNCAGNLAGKKITYFLDYIRQHLRLSTREIDDDFLERVAERSGVSGTEVRTLFAVIRAVQRQPKLSETELRRLSTAIDGFYRKSKR